MLSSAVPSTSSTYPSAEDREVQNGVRASVSLFKPPANSDHLVLQGGGRPLNGSPCLPCQHREDGQPEGEQGGMCVCFNRVCYEVFLLE